MPYKPLGDDKKIHDTHMPPTFTVHTYSSNFGTVSFGPLPDASEHGRTQSVLRMGRSFSTRMSSQGPLGGLYTYRKDRCRRDRLWSAMLMPIASAGGRLRSGCFLEMCKPGIHSPGAGDV